jgi:hypothetical protein
MLESVVGLIACASLYLGAIWTFVWIGKRRIEWASRHGVAVGPKPQFPSVPEIWTRHSAEMTVIYGVFFLALALAGFPLWQRVGIAAFASLVFGSFWIANSPSRIALDVASPARRTASTAGYWCLSVTDWFSYMGVLCFGTAFLVELL